LADDGRNDDEKGEFARGGSFVFSGACVCAEFVAGGPRQRREVSWADARWVIEATKGLSEAQFKFKAAPDRWSVAETLEHIALAEDFIFGITTDKVMKAPAGAPDRDYKKTDAMVLAMVPDHSHKAQAPPPLVPTGKWTPAESLDHFLKSRAKTIEYMKTTPDLREHVVTDDPLGQPMDGYEFLLFIGAHSERHTKQILEVKADPNFPKM
jgi:hypothetical protein